MGFIVPPIPILLKLPPPPSCLKIENVLQLWNNYQFKFHTKAQILHFRRWASSDLLRPGKCPLMSLLCNKSFRHSNWNRSGVVKAVLRICPFLCHPLKIDCYCPDLLPNSKCLSEREKAHYGQSFFHFQATKYAHFWNIIPFLGLIKRD